MANTMRPMRLETVNALCTLRPWLPTDVPSLVHHANNVNVWRNLTQTFPHPYTEADAISWVKTAAEPGRSIHLAIEFDGLAVGGLGAIAGEGIACATAQFGYWLGQEHWSKGLATAAAGALLNHLKEHKPFARIEASVFAWNPASMRVLEKLGFVREGVLRHSVTKDGQLIDSVMYAYAVAI
jgi:RimJ/RimL family protein N-acetyltransferase